MIANQFPPLPLAEWQATRTTLHGYAQILGAIRGSLSPRQKHSGHRSLLVAGSGLTTTPIPGPASAGPLTFELLLDLAVHRLVITSNRGHEVQHRLQGQSLAEFTDQVLTGLALMGANITLDRSPFSSAEAGAYDVGAVERFWQALSQVDQVMRRFRGELRGETMPVQLWPHHLDLAMLWFSGRRVPGHETDKPQNADEQMNFGFSTGDEGIAEPYFYATAYPLPAELPNAKLPDGVTWHSQGWQGALLLYSTLVGAPDAEERLLNYLRTVQEAGERLMRA